MSKHSRRYRDLVATLPDRDELLAPTAAIEAAQKGANTKFDEAIEVAVSLGIDPRQSDQNVRGTVVLPHGTGRTPNVAVIAEGADADAAREAGADTVGGEELVSQIDGGWGDFDILCATPAMMRMVGRLGRKLGPRMPNPKAGTLGPNIGEIVAELKSGKIQFRADNRGGVVRSSIGKKSFSTEQLVENFNSLVGALVRARPSTAKGPYLKRIFISSTMGPSFKVDCAAAATEAANA